MYRSFATKHKSEYYRLDGNLHSIVYSHSEYRMFGVSVVKSLLVYLL